MINPNYLAQPADVQVFVGAIELIRELAAADSFSELNGSELAPGDGDLEGFIRSQSSTLWHPAEHAKSETTFAGRGRPAAVRLWRPRGLRVTDASVMPTVTSGNTVAACFMIGEKAADTILSGN